MVRGMALSTAQIYATVMSLMLVDAPAWAQSPERVPAVGARVEVADPGLSAECRVPDHELFVLAPLEAVARAAEVPVVFRSKAVRYLTEQHSNAEQNPFQLNELASRCMAEHVVRAVLLSIRLAGEPAKAN